MGFVSFLGDTVFFEPCFLFQSRLAKGNGRQVFWGRCEKKVIDWGGLCFWGLSLSGLFKKEIPKILGEL